MIHEYGKPPIRMYLGDQRLLTVADSRWETRPAGNDASFGGPKWTVDRTVFEMWLSGL